MRLVHAYAFTDLPEGGAVIRFGWPLGTRLVERPHEVALFKVLSIVSGLATYAIVLFTLLVAELAGTFTLLQRTGISLLLLLAFHAVWLFFLGHVTRNLPRVTPGDSPL